MEFQRENPDYRVPGGSRYAEGNLRTAIRMFLRTEVKEGRLKLPESDQFKIDKFDELIICSLAAPRLGVVKLSSILKLGKRLVIHL